MTGPNFLSISESLIQIQQGTLKPQSLKKACLQQIERLNPILNALITVCGDDDTHLEEVQRSGLLPGIPVAVKDLFETKGIRTTARSRFFKDYIPT